MRISFPLFKNKAKTKPKKRNKKGNWGGQRPAMFPRFSSLIGARLMTQAQRRGGGGGGHRNNLQSLYKRKGQFNQKLRKRKYKLRVTGATFIRRTSRGLKFPRRPGYLGVKVDRGFRTTFPTFIGIEKTVLRTKGKVRVHHRKYPDFFVTRKSSKSRMGKGKGKIAGRVLKIKPGETLFDLRVKNLQKKRRALRAFRRAVPSTFKFVYKNKWVARLLSNFFRNRPWNSLRPKKRKRKFWEKVNTAEKWSWAFFIKRSLFFKDDHFAYALPRRYVRWSGTKKHQHDQLAWMWKKCLANMNARVHRGIVVLDYPLDSVSRESPYAPNYFVGAHTGGVRKTGFSGGWSRRGKASLYMIKNYARRYLARRFAPDSDGYTGIFKMGNLAIKRKLRREKLSGRSPSVKVGSGIY